MKKEKLLFLLFLSVLVIAISGYKENTITFIKNDELAVAPFEIKKNNTSNVPKTTKEEIELDLVKKLKPKKERVQLPSPSTEYKITFDSAGGTKTESQIVLIYNKIMEPNIPTKKGYKFLGWYYKETKWDFNIHVIEDMVLIAKWGKNGLVDTKNPIMPNPIQPVRPEPKKPIELIPKPTPVLPKEYTE